MDIKQLFTHKQKPEVKTVDLSNYEPYCEYCDGYISTDDKNNNPIKYCPDCGHELLQPSICIFCGSPIASDAKYCTGCGNIAIR